MDSANSHHFTEAIQEFENQNWLEAISALEVVLRDGGDRSSWLLYSSALERGGNKTLAREVANIANRLYPARDYDSTRAFEIYNAAAFERDQMAEFLAINLRDIRRLAKARTLQSRIRRTYPAYVYWDSNDLPELVRAARSSIKENLPAKFRLLELNKESIDRSPYIDKNVLRKVETEAQKSDIIRLHLLSNTGGLWLDSTCLLNEDMRFFVPQFTAYDFFAFTYRGSRTGSWFMWAKATSYRLQLIRAALDSWLLSGRPWSNYFMLHDVIEMLYWVDAKYRKAWDEGLYIHPRNALAMLQQLEKPIADHEWFDLRHRSPVNKLSWKYDKSKLNDRRTTVSRLISDAK